MPKIHHIVKHICKISAEKDVEINTSNARDYLFILLKLMWLSKSPLDQNLNMMYLKFNGNFKSHINFKRIKRWSLALLNKHMANILGIDCINR